MSTLPLAVPFNPSDMCASRHNHEVALVTYGRPYSRIAFSSPIVAMVSAWAQYALDHKERYDAPIGEDYFIGHAWADTGRSLLTMLNGQLGNLDAGTLDGFIRATMSANGVDSE